MGPADFLPMCCRSGGSCTAEEQAVSPSVHVVFAPGAAPRWARRGGCLRPNRRPGAGWRGLGAAPFRRRPPGGALPGSSAPRLPASHRRSSERPGASRCLLRARPGCLSLPPPRGGHPGATLLPLSIPSFFPPSLLPSLRRTPRGRACFPARMMNFSARSSLPAAAARPQLPGRRRGGKGQGGELGGSGSTSTPRQVLTEPVRSGLGARAGARGATDYYY